MKKLLMILLVLSLIGAAIPAFADSLIPSPGMKVENTSLSDMYGKIGYDGNGNKYRCVYNASGTVEYQNEPAYYNWGAGNDYTVGAYVDTSSIEGFAGIVYCDLNGATSIPNGYPGWIQISGYCSPYVSYEGTAIAIGDILGGTANHGAKTAGTAGYQYLTRQRAAYTSTTVTTAETRTLQFNPRATVAYSTSTAAAKGIILRSGY